MDKIKLNNTQYTFKPNSMDIGINGVFLLANGEISNVVGRAINIVQSKDGSNISFDINFAKTTAGEIASKIKNMRLDTFLRIIEYELKDGIVWINKYVLFAINIIT